MNSIRKCSIKKHHTENIKPAVRWQSYLLALVMVGGFFLFTQKVLAEAKSGGKAPEPVAAAPMKVTETPDLSQVSLGLQSETEQLAANSKLVAQDALDTATILEEASEPASQAAMAETQVGPQLPVEPQAAPQEAAAGDDDPELAAAQVVVTEFYNDLNSGRIGTAYDKLSPEFRDTLSYERFDSGYSATSAIKCEVQHSENLGEDLMRFDVAISVTEDDSDSKYYATCLVKKVDDSWFLDGVGQVRG